MSVDTFADVGDDGQDDTTNEPEGGRYHAIYGGGPGYPPGDEGRSFIGKMPHPPLYCPNPKIMANMRGLYPCPGCGAKFRHSTHVPVRERAYENTERFWENVSDGIGQAWEVAWPSLQTLLILSARAIAWMARTAVNTIIRHRGDNNDASSADSVPDRRDNGHENAEITCTTSDGIHVMKHENGREKCIECGMMLVRETA